MRYTLEDVFVGGDADKLAWVAGWRNLPHVPREVVKLFQYPQQFAETVFERIERALRKRIDHGDAPVRSGRLFVVSAAAPPPESEVARTPELSAHFVVSTDRQLVAAGRALASDEPQLLRSRLEGEFLVSYQTPGGWTGISKDVLTEVVGAGRDAKIVGLPDDAIQVLELMCRDVARST